MRGRGQPCGAVRMKKRDIRRGQDRVSMKGVCTSTRWHKIINPLAGLGLRFVCREHIASLLRRSMFLRVPCSNLTREAFEAVVPVSGGEIDLNLFRDADTLFAACCGTGLEDQFLIQNSAWPSARTRAVLSIIRPHLKTSTGDLHPEVSRLRRPSLTSLGP